MSTCVVRRRVEEVLHGVIGGGELGDVCATIGSKLVDINSTLSACGVTPDCTVRLHARIRGGSRENVPGEWTCSNCFADRCWPVRTRCSRCGEPRGDAPLGSPHQENERPQGPLGRQPPAPAGAVPQPSEDMVKAVKLLQSVMTPEDSTGEASSARAV